MKRDKSFIWAKESLLNLKLNGNKVAIVGGTGGIGRELSRVMAFLGARVVIVGRMFRDSSYPGIEFIQADLSLMSEADRVASRLPAEKLDIVVFTTGIFAAPRRQLTKEGIEEDIAVSYLSRLVILRQIASRLGKSREDQNRKVRVFIMGFPGTGEMGTIDDLNAEKSYKALRVHMNTVAGNEILVLDSVKRFSGINFYGLNPGIMSTNIRSNFLGGNPIMFRLTESLIGLLAKSTKTYAERLIPLIVSPDLERHSGVMFNDKAQAILPSKGLTGGYIRDFIFESERLVASVGIKFES